MKSTHNDVMPSAILLPLRPLSNISPAFLDAICEGCENVVAMAARIFPRPQIGFSSRTKNCALSAKVPHAILLLSRSLIHPLAFCGDGYFFVFPMEREKYTFFCGCHFYTDLRRGIFLILYFVCKHLKA